MINIFVPSEVRTPLGLDFLRGCCYSFEAIFMGVFSGNLIRPMCPYRRNLRCLFILLHWISSVFKYRLKKLTLLILAGRPYDVPDIAEEIKREAIYGVSCCLCDGPCFAVIQEYAGYIEVEYSQFRL